MHDFSFIGRPDGIGNRVEEIIRLEMICSQTDSRCEYVWSNRRSNRSYDICLRGDRVSLVGQKEPEHPVRQMSDFDPVVTREAMLASARTLAPTFGIRFEGDARPVGVHIRASDRIGLDHPHFMKDEQELRDYLSETIYLLNEKKPKHVFVCSECERCRSVFLRYLDPDIEIVQPVTDSHVSPEYEDFFALSQCSEVWMVSRFSTFAIAASLIGNVPLVSFVDDPDVRERYQAIFQYRRTRGRNIVRERLLDRSFWSFVLKHVQRIRTRIA